MADPGRPLRIEIVEEAGDWSGFDAHAVIDALEAGLHERLPGVAGIAVMALADDTSVRGLNSRFRDQDKPTNVLSFPSGEEPGPDAHLGDLILAGETLRREAAEQGKAERDHFAHLALHGVLHLLGYDHDSHEQAQTMERLETLILADMGIDDPYREIEAARDPALGDADA